MYRGLGKDDTTSDVNSTILLACCVILIFDCFDKVLPHLFAVSISSRAIVINNIVIQTKAMRYNGNINIYVDEQAI